MCLGGCFPAWAEVVVVQNGVLLNARDVRLRHPRERQRVNSAERADVDARFFSRHML